MQIAYLIAAHNTPRHLPRLIEALASPSATFFVHFDRKSPAVDLSGVRGARVVLTQHRVPVYWGDFSQVEATMVMLRQALAQGRFDRFVLLSGSDYPVRPADEIEAFFARHPDRQFMNLVKMPNDTVRKPLTLVTTRYLRPRRTRAGELVRKVCRRLGVYPWQRDHRPVFGTMDAYGGSSWWALTGDAAAYVVRFADEHPRFVRWFERLACADESFFHTIIGNSPFAARISRSVTYADWRGGGVSPAVMTPTHIEWFTAQDFVDPPNAYGEGPVLFARKFPDDSAALLAPLHRAWERQAVVMHRA